MAAQQVAFDPWVVKPNGLNTLKASTPYITTFTGRIMDVFTLQFRVNGNNNVETRCILKLAPHDSHVINQFGYVMGKAKPFLEAQFPLYKFSPGLRKAVDPFGAGTYHCIDVPLTPGGYTVCDFWCPFTEFASSITPGSLRHFVGALVKISLKIRGLEVVIVENIPRVRVIYTVSNIVLSSPEYL